MDAHTLHLLEYDKIRDILSGYAASSLGKELARQLEPRTGLPQIRAEIALVSEMTALLDEGPGPPLGGVHDVRLVVRRASIGAMLSAEELLQVADTLTCTGHIYRFRMRLGPKYAGLIDVLNPVEDMGLVAKQITGCIDSRSHVLDMASPELTRIRHQLGEIEERIQNKLKGLLRDPELRRILRYPNATVSGDHYVLPVSVNHRHKVPGVVHRTSSTGETVFIEPSVIASVTAERVVLKGDEEREVKRILRRLSAEVGKVARPLSFALDAIARLDLIQAKARYSHDFAMTAPTLNSEGKVWLPQARHPLLEHMFRARKAAAPAPRSTLAPGASGQGEGDMPHTPDPFKVVPIDVRLGHGFNLLVITGPNTGGKTVTLKTTGLLCLMAQSGMHVPTTQGASIPVFEHVLADIGDEQSLEQSLSTFSSHISRLASILQVASANSLILLDEMGAGTDPTEGAALGRAILDKLDSMGCRAMVTTHLGDLKTYAFSNNHAENAAVEFDIETLRPTYRLHIGQFGMSNALRIARRLKLPRDLLKRARRYLRRRQRRAPEMAELQKHREQAELARADALVAQQEADRQRQEYQQKLAVLEREATEAATLREARSRLQPNDIVHVPRFDKAGRIIRIDHKRNIAVVSVGLGQWEVALDEVIPVAK